MKKQPIQSATSLPPSPDAERKVRMLKYTVAMVIRLICFLVAALLYKTLGWWTLIPVVAAVILPYVAVVLANTVIQSKITPVERPGALVPLSLPHSPGADG
jgi:predicted tellurium resistance membrane protein TerC